MITLSVSPRTWANAIASARNQLLEAGHYDNNEDDEVRLTVNAVRAALCELQIEVDVEEGAVFPEED